MTCSGTPARLDQPVKIGQALTAADANGGRWFGEAGAGWRTPTSSFLAYFKCVAGAG